MNRFLMFTCVFLLVFGVAYSSFATPFGTTLSENTTGQLDSIFTGAPDDNYWGLGGASLTFDFGVDRIVNGSGTDFNIYEVDNGAVEFSYINVFVSIDNTNWVDVSPSQSDGVRIAGDDTHGNNSFFKSYDLGSLTEAQYIRIVGTGSNTTPSHNTNFDLDAVGLINYELGGQQPPAVPEPGTMLLLGCGLIGLAGISRKKKNKRKA